MKAEISRKYFAGIPHGGTSVSLEHGDIVSIGAAAVGLIRALAVGAASLAGLGLAALICASMSVEEDTSETDLVLPSKKNLQLPPAPDIPLGLTLVKVKTSNREFCGFCINDTIEFQCEGDSLIALTSRLNRIYSYSEDYRRHGFVNAIDGSTYKFVEKVSPLEFVTILGKQTVNITTPRETIIQAASISEVHDLGDRLARALKGNMQEIVEAVGQDTLSKYFDIHEITPENGPS